MQDHSQQLREAHRHLSAFTMYYSIASAGVADDFAGKLNLSEHERCAITASQVPKD